MTAHRRTSSPNDRILEDPLREARGILNGLFFAFIFWSIAGAAGYLVVSR